MACTRQLTASPALALAALALAVLFAHVMALRWLDAQWREPSILQALATPMLTRQIVQEAPPSIVAAVAAPVPATRSARVLDSAPRQGTPTLAQSPSDPASGPAPVIPAQPASAAGDATPTAVASAHSASPASADSGLPPEAGPPAANSATASAPAPPATTAASMPTVASATATVTAQASPTLAQTSPNAWLDAWPTDTRLTYKLGGNFRGPLSGDARVQWLRPGDRYEARIDINIGFLASVVMTSQGRVTPFGLRPERYEEVRRNRRSVTMDDAQLRFANGKTAPRPEGVQDTASQFVELAQQFASGRAVLATGKSVSFWMARPGGVDFWTYDITEKVTLQTPNLGPVEAFHLKPRPLAEPRGNITAEMWFAPTLQYLPVRIRINMAEDTWVDLMVEKIEQR